MPSSSTAIQLSGLPLIFAMPNGASDELVQEAAEPFDFDAVVEDQHQRAKRQAERAIQVRRRQRPQILNAAADTLVGEATAASRPAAGRSHS